MEGTAALVEAFSAEVDVIIDSWQAPFAEAARTVAEQSSALGPIDLHGDSQEILALGGDAASRWIKATEGVSLIDTIVSAWVSLALLTRFADPNKRNRIHLFTDVSLDEWEANDRVDGRLGAWEAHQRGLTLDLADRATYAERVNRLAQSRALRDARAREASKDKPLRVA